ncbi:contractile injection system tape measure protein [Lacinutrix himadriensis]|uniref:contractile injection system tape measure protein n=1 Tax=Lacinutrix himadriensis TaxID=641549 RepID=UPI0006E37D85|nr:contractile injection system tape measure protein [Lacinutrix himadriensis]
MIIKEGVSVANSGLVLLSGYFSMLFEKLDLTTNNSFINMESQLKAVHFVQYLATGMEQTQESYLAFNKVLCGISITTPIQDAIEISEDQKKLMDGLIGAAINQWPAIGETSIDGFRGNWLVREGMLKEEQDYWELTVEKKAYDLLIHKSPFNFSKINFPWMLKPLRVNWPY